MILTLLATLVVATNSEDPAPLPPASQQVCSTEEHAQFDFWVGEWEVHPNGTQNVLARSRVERLYNGCAVRENWMPFSGNSGGSLNSYDPKTNRWHQTWIGSAPGRVEFVGGAVGMTMVLTGVWPSPASPHQLIRMTYTPNDDGTVRQHGEASTDHGVSWQTSFDLIYRPVDQEQP